MPELLLVLNGSIGVVSPWQNIWLTGWLTCPLGFTVMLNCFVGPSQVFPAFVKCGVMVRVATTGEVPVFDAVKIGIEPLPVLPSPIDVWLFVQV